MSGKADRRAVKATLAVVGLGALLVASACDDGETLEGEPRIEAPQEVRLEGPWADGAEIHKDFTCDGDGVSPGLSWTAVEGVEEYALMMTDPDAPDGTFVHWVVFAIPGTVTEIDEGRIPEGAKVGSTSFGDEGYGGPCPPEGDDPHRYELTLYALERGPEDELEAGASADDVLESIECCVSATGTLTGTYGR
jgi:Raf kinase inhibitor-like YbhB/YbcL family protein